MEQGFARGMQREERGSSSPARRPSKKALAGENLTYNKDIIKGFLQEGNAKVRQILVSLLQTSPFTLQMSFLVAEP